MQYPTLCIHWHTAPHAGCLDWSLQAMVCPMCIALCYHFKIAWPTPVNIVVARIHVSSLPLATASYGKYLPARFGMTMAAAGCERIRCQTQIPRHLETEGNGALKSAAHLFYRTTYNLWTPNPRAAPNGTQKLESSYIRSGPH